jgi:hypothetical protein
LPSEHGLQSFPPAAELNSPIGHGEQLVQPGALQMAPGGQIEQEELPLAEENRPALHCEQVEDFAEEKVPAAQSTHELEPVFAAEYLPAAHDAHCSPPEIELNCPLPHGRQDFAPTFGWIVPGVQAVHVVEPVVDEKRPGSHRLHEDAPDSADALPAAQLTQADADAEEKVAGGQVEQAVQPGAAQIMPDEHRWQEIEPSAVLKLPEERRGQTRATKNRQPVTFTRDDRTKRAMVRFPSVCPLTFRAQGALVSAGYAGERSRRTGQTCVRHRVQVLACERMVTEDHEG